jgi:thymidylate synthase (FAD)
LKNSAGGTAIRIMVMQTMKSNVRVKLLAFTPLPESVVAAAARLCYSASSAEDLIVMLHDDKEQRDKFIKNLARSGHLSPFEHVSFTFAVDGISRACSHQLVRHRIASYSQQSQRYVSMIDANYIVPDSIMENEKALTLFKDMMRQSHEAYKSLAEWGIPLEDARYVLPNAWETKIVVTMNARELHHFFSLRLCKRAQWEIRRLAKLMLIEVRKVAGVIFDVAGPPCVTKGKCEEAKPCGKPYSSIEELLS